MRHAHKFAAWQAKHRSLAVDAVDTAREAVSGADIICTVTASTEPVLEGDWIAPGTHINAVGSSVPFAIELDTAAVVKSKLFVEHRGSTLNEAGDFLFPKKEGTIDDDHILSEIGDVLAGKSKGRTSTRDITLFKFLGLAVEDVAAAHFIYKKMTAQGASSRVEFNAAKKPL